MSTCSTSMSSIPNNVGATVCNGRPRSPLALTSKLLATPSSSFQYPNRKYGKKNSSSKLSKTTGSTPSPPCVSPVRRSKSAEVKMNLLPEPALDSSFSFVTENSEDENLGMVDQLDILDLLVQSLDDSVHERSNGSATSKNEKPTLTGDEKICSVYNKSRVRRALSSDCKSNSNTSNHVIKGLDKSLSSGGTGTCVSNISVSTCDESSDTIALQLNGSLRSNISERSSNIVSPNENGNIVNRRKERHEYLLSLGSTSIAATSDDPATRKYPEHDTSVKSRGRERHSTCKPVKAPNRGHRSKSVTRSPTSSRLGNGQSGRHSSSSKRILSSVSRSASAGDGRTRCKSLDRRSSPRNLESRTHETLYLNNESDDDSFLDLAIRSSHRNSKKVDNERENETNKSSYSSAVKPATVQVIQRNGMSVLKDTTREGRKQKTERGIEGFSSHRRARKKPGRIGDLKKSFSRIGSARMILLEDDESYRIQKTTPI